MKELDWIVNLLINLHSFCESNGLKTLSDKVADAIEEAAPLIAATGSTGTRATKRTPSRAARSRLRSTARRVGPEPIADLA